MILFIFIGNVHKFIFHKLLNPISGGDGREVKSLPFFNDYFFFFGGGGCFFFFLEFNGAEALV